MFLIRFSESWKKEVSYSWNNTLALYLEKYLKNIPLSAQAIFVQMNTTQMYVPI
ncbi:hypothetical protein VCSRO46_3605 [Vibrio cholerae]|nr:hypothetical protein VCSRO46_3605 [Vibrio cholerae]